MKTGFSQKAGAYLQAFGLACSILLMNSVATAQIGGFSPEQIEALAGRADGGATIIGADDLSDEPEVQIYKGRPAENKPSRLEIFYSSRASQPLVQFGYETFGNGRDVTLRKVGGVQENYVIGIGDTISIDLRGQENLSYQLKVDAGGRIILPKLEPVAAAGRPFGEFREQLKRQIEDAYIATNVFTSIGEVREVSVLMSGEINNPGPLTLSGLSTSVDALLLAGGVKKTGSLRDIRVYRGDQVIEIDLYSVLLGDQNSADFSLVEGDRIHVAPIGKILAIGGWVKRPGIYELSKGQSALTAEHMIELAGGFEVKGRYRLSLMRVDSSGTVAVVDAAGASARMNEGDILLVETNDQRARQAVYLEGHVRRGGTIPLSKAATLKTLLEEGEVLGTSVYMHFGLIARIEPRSHVKTYIAFSLSDAIYGGKDLALQEDDVVHIFSQEEIQNISSTLVERETSADRVEEEGEGEVVSEDIGTHLASDLGARRLEGFINVQAQQIREGEVDRLSKAQSAGVLTENELPTISIEEMLETGLRRMGLARRIDFSDVVLLSLFEESRISFFGAVKAPGDYFVVPGISLGQALEIAGGPLVQADLSAAEITSTQFEPMQGMARSNRRMVRLDAETLQNVKLGPFDVVRLRRVFSNRIDGSVEISGEIKYPGHLDLMRGERLSSVLQRVGGLTSTAYPYGAVFTRISAARAEREARNRLADQMESQLATVVAKGVMGRDGAVFISELIAKIKKSKTIGRISVQVDPAVLVIGGEDDLLLEPGDRLTIPPRPNSVAVVGEVLSPASYGFKADLDRRDYVKLAGGYSRFADKKRAFVIMPDGQSKRMNEGRWQFGDNMIAPGSTVVVPRNLSPIQWDEFFLSISEISSQLALTAASVSVIGRD